jgi:hypothetical protein
MDKQLRDRAESERRRFLIHRDDDLSIGPTARTIVSGGLTNGAQASRPTSATALMPAMSHSVAFM